MRGLIVAMAMVTVAVSTACGGECRGSADATVDALIPQDQEIHCIDDETFEVDGRSVTFTHVEYGARRDCPSGCFSSHLCAIEDGDGVELYRADFYDPAEEPLGFDEECPGSERMDTFECEPSGSSHPLTATDDFRRFARNQPLDNGPFRFCF